MELNCKISKSDYWNFYKYAIVNIDYFRKQIMYSLVILLVLAMLTTLVINGDIYFWLVIVIVLPFLFLGIILIILKRQILSSNKVPVGNTLLKIENQGLRVINNIHNVLYYWVSIDKIINNSNYLYVLTMDNQAIIIPKTKDDDYSVFFDKVSACL